MNIKLRNSNRKTEANGRGNSLVVQWLGLQVSTPGGPDSIPGWRTKILQTVQCSQNKDKFKKKGKRNRAADFEDSGNPSEKATPHVYLYNFTYIYI